MMIRFMYDLVNVETMELVKKDCVSQIKVADGLAKESVIASIKFFFSEEPENEVVNIRMM